MGTRGGSVWTDRRLIQPSAFMPLYRRHPGLFNARLPGLTNLKSTEATRAKDSTRCRTAGYLPWKNLRL